jgi:hypothetical protein
MVSHALGAQKLSLFAIVCPLGRHRTLVWCSVLWRCFVPFCRIVRFKIIATGDNGPEPPHLSGQEDGVGAVVGVDSHCVRSSSPRSVSSVGPVMSATSPSTQASLTLGVGQRGLRVTVQGDRPSTDRPVVAEPHWLAVRQRHSPTPRARLTTVRRSSVTSQSLQQPP